MNQISPDSNAAPGKPCLRVIAAIPWRRVFAWLWALYGVLGFLYFFTKGLAVDCNGDGKEICYVSDFNGVAQDDYLFLIPPGIIFGACGVAWGLRRWANAPGVADFVVYALLLLLQAFCLLMAEMPPFTDTFADTIRLTHNVIVLAWSLAYAMLWIMFIAGTVTWLGKGASRLLR